MMTSIVFSGIGLAILLIFAWLGIGLLFRGLLGLWHEFRMWRDERHPHRREFKVLRKARNEQRQHRARLWLASKTIVMPGLLALGLVLPFALSPVALTGCATGGGTNTNLPPVVNPLLTPAAVATEVTDLIAAGVLLYPPATPEVTAARDVICAEVARTNLDPNAIFADLRTLNITNTTTKAIITGGVLVYNSVFLLLNTNSLANVQPYLNALCTGFSQGLPSAGLMARQRPLPPHL